MALASWLSLEKADHALESNSTTIDYKSKEMKYKSKDEINFEGLGYDAKRYDCKIH